MSETHTIHDPFLGKSVQVSDCLVDRLRGHYAMGPHLPNGKPEFGWRQFQAPPIQHEAAAEIERLEADNDRLRLALEEIIQHADLDRSDWALVPHHLIENARKALDEGA